MKIGQKIHVLFTQQAALWYLFMVLLFAPILSFATHIVGGEVGYRWLDGDRYEIVVRVYRDCINGAANAPFDDPASVGIFDRSGLLLQDVRIAATKDTFLSNNLDACILATTTVCVHTMTYKAVVNLPFRTGGYQIVYQRCCRNVTIKNIVSPLETGATYDIWLTEAAMRRSNRNRSSTFKRWPDIYICNNRPLDFDHSAIDPDGDSLVYRLCTPFQGATFANPQPQPPNFPPYDTLIWVKPTYNLYNMLGAGEPLRINARSGLLTARPGLLGQFVVGICVDEYDRKTKTLIASTRRDFQYNVQNCEGVTAAFFAPETQCDSTKVRFRNESIGASSYLWLFDAPRSNLISTDVNPIYTFPAYNTYKVSLIAEPGRVCADTFSRQIKLFKSGIKADFKSEVLSCGAESIIRLQDLSIDSSAAIVKRKWKITYGDGGVINATGADTLVRVPSIASGTIMLTVINANGCERTISRSYTAVGTAEPCQGIPDTLRACVGTTVPLNPNGISSTAYAYRWKPSASISDTTAANPLYTVTQNGKITLTITANSAQSCTCTKTITVIATPRPKADFSVDGGIGTDPVLVSSCDGRTVSFKSTSTGAKSVKWIIGSLSNPSQVSTQLNPVFTFPDTGTYRVTLIALGECNDTLSKTIKVSFSKTNVDFIFNYTNCVFDGSTIKLLNVSNNPGIQIASLTWKLSDGRRSTEASPSFTFTDTGRVVVTLIVQTTQGCVDSVSQSIKKAPIAGVAFPDTITVCRGIPFRIPGNNDPNLVYTWLPETGLDDPTIGNPIFSPQQNTKYTVDVSVPGIPGCKARDTMMAIVPGNMDLRVAGAGADGTPVCTPQTTLTASANRAATFRWLDANGVQVGTGTKFTANVATQRNLQLEATDVNGCIEKLAIALLGSPIVFSAPDSLLACTGDTIRINTTQGPGQILTFAWTPLNAFASGATTASPVLASLPGIRKVFVAVSNAAGCILRDSVQVAIVDANHNLSFKPEIQCNGNTVIFRNTSSNAFRYLWSFGDGSNSTEDNPEHVFTQPGTYTVTLTLKDAVACRKTVTRVVNISTEPLLGLKVPNEAITCGEDVKLTALANEGTTFRWTTRKGELLSSNASVTVNPSPGTTVYYVTVQNELRCTQTDSVSVTDNGVDVTLITPSGGNRIDQCAPENVQIQVRNNVASHLLTYQWIPTVNVVSGGNTPNPVLRPTEIGINGIRGIISNQFECEDTLTIIINLGTLNSGLPDTVKVCPNAPSPLAPNANKEYTYQWSPSTGLSAANVSNPTFTGSTAVTYLVTVTKTSGGTSCQDVDTVVVLINPEPKLKVSTKDTIACVGTTLSLIASGADEYSWNAGNPQGTLNFDAEGGIAISSTNGVELLYSVVGRNKSGCTDTISGIRIRFVNFDPGNTISPLNICKGDTVRLNPNGNPAFTYQWSPVTGLNLSKPFNPLATITQTTRFTVTITDPTFGCKKERAVTVNVRSIEGFKASNDTAVCTGTNLTLSANANGTNVNFRWLNANGQQIGSGKTISVTPAVGVNLYISEVSDGACSAKDTVKVTRADFQPGDLSSPQNACAGQPLALNPNGKPAYQYQWTPTTGLNLSNPSNPIATLTTSTTYKVTVTDPVSGCRLEKDIQVIVNNLNDLNIVPADTSICQPNGVTLRIAGAAGASIRWLDANGVQIGTGRSLVPSLKPGLNLIIAEATLGACVKRDSSRVTLKEFQPGDLATPQTVCAGQPLPLNPNGKPSYQYQWSPSTGLNLSNPSNPIATLTTSTTFKVTVTDPATGCRLEKNLQVNVTDLSDLDAIPAETNLCEPGFVLLTIRGAQGASIRWLDANGQVIFTGRSLSVTPNPGLNLYIAEATLGACTKRDTAKVRLNDFKPGDLASPQEVCAGVATELNPKGNPAYTYNWSPTTGLNLSKPYNPVATVSVTTTYTVTVTDPATKCTDTKSIVVRVSPPLTVTALPDTSLCQPGPLTLRATTSRPTVITWFSDAALKTPIGTGNRIRVNVPAGKSVYYAVATDTNDVCIKAQIQAARANGGITIGKGGPYAGAPLDSAVINVVDLTKGAPPASITACRNVRTPINPNGNPILVYRWSPARGLSDSTSATPSATLTAPTTYTVTITDKFGACSIVRQVAVSIAAPINADAGRDTTLCSQSPFNLVAKGTGAAVFEWSRNRTISPILGTGAQFSITPDTVSRTYYVRITNAAGCTEIDSVKVIARPVRASLPATVSPCEVGDSINLSVVNSDRTQVLQYLWSPANLFISNPRTGPNATAIAQNGASLQVQVTNQFGCSTTLRTQVNIVDLASKVKVTADKTTITVGESATIRVENCPDCTYSWTPPTGLNTTTGSTVVASPTDTTTYTVKVTSGKCTEEFKITINVTGPYCVEPYIFVPTAFTPNNDGANDILYVRGRGIEKMTFIIYNRWGQKMFETSNPKEGWDGTFRGKKLPADVYGFYLLANCIDGTVYRKQGNVTLIR